MPISPPPKSPMPSQQQGSPSSKAKSTVRKEVDDPAHRQDSSAPADDGQQPSHSLPSAHHAVSGAPPVAGKQQTANGKQPVSKSTTPSSKATPASGSVVFNSLGGSGSKTGSFGKSGVAGSSGRNSRSSQFSVDARRGSGTRAFLSDDEDFDDGYRRRKNSFTHGRNVVIQACSMEMTEEDFPDSGKNFQKSDKDVAEIIQQINSLILFQGYEDVELKSVIEYMYRRPVTKGEAVIREGEEGDAFYVVRTGKYECTTVKNGVVIKIRTYNGSGYFGDLALIHHAPRAASITAISDGELWVLNATRYVWLKQRQARRNAECFERVIRGIPMFSSNLTSSHINRLIDAIEVVTMHKDEVICQQGDPGDAMYFILDGQVGARLGGKQVRLMGTNEFFGERALVLDEGRAATCVAVTPVKLAKLAKENFELLIPDKVVASMRDYVAKAYAKAPAAK